MELTPWVVAICRDMAEGGTGRKYLSESLAGFYDHQDNARDMGLLDHNYELTPAGMRVGTACKKLPGGLAQMHRDKYIETALSVL
jgi:hypothetical protein